MSIKLMQLVWEQDIPQGPKMLLLCLADFANDEGEGYPGTDTICARCSFSPASLYRHLAALEDEQFMARHQMGDRTLYVLNVERIRQLPLAAHKQGRKSKGLADIHPVKVRPKRSQIESTDSQNESGDSQIETLSNCELGPLTVRDGTSQIESPIKQPPANHHEPPRGAAKPGRGDQFAALDARRRKLIEPYLDKLHPSVELERFADFVDHRSVCRKPLSIGAWNAVSLLLNQLAADGHDLNESLKQTLGKGLCEPIVPRKDPGGTNGFNPQQTRANDDFSEVNYGPGTAPSELPAFLQSTDDVTSA